MSPPSAVAAARLSAGAPAHPPAPAPADADAPICLDFLKGRCTRAQCRFLHPDLAQYEKLSGAVHARAGRRVCEVWAMTGQCKFGAKCSRLHPSVVPSPQQPQQALTLMLPLALVPQAMVMPVAPTPAQPPAAAPAVPLRWPLAAPPVLPPAPLDMHSLGPVTVRPPSPVSPHASHPLGPAAPFFGHLGASKAPAMALGSVPSGPHLPLLPPVAVPFGPSPPRPQHVTLPPTADPPLVGIRQLAQSILQSVEGAANPCTVRPVKKELTVPLVAEELSHFLHPGQSPVQPPAPAALREQPLSPPLPTPRPDWEEAIVAALRRLETTRN